jgi:hypothetical protein
VSSARPTHDGSVAVGGQRDGTALSDIGSDRAGADQLAALLCPLLRVKTHAAPVPSSSTPPTMAVLPSADSATDVPAAPVPTSLLPCWFQAPPLRVKTHAAPAPELSTKPPTMAVLPSPDSATE